MGRYAYKKSLPDWDAATAADLKIAIKAYILRALLNKATDEEIHERVRKEIEDFREEFPPEDAEKAEGYARELSALADDVIRMTRTAMGGLTPYMFAAAVAPKGNLSEVQKANIGKAAQVILRQDNPAIVREVATRYKFQPSEDAEPQDALPDMAYNRATPAQTLYKDVHERTRAWIGDFQKIKESKFFIANVNPRAYTEMGVRFEAYQNAKARLRQQGVRLVYVAPHANCSQRCQRWQGRVYSLDGTYGTKDGHRFIPIEDAADKVTYTSRRTGRTYQAGLFAYNCRHSMAPYEDGQEVERIPDDVIERQRKIEEVQREMEREIRFQKEKGVYWEILAEKNKSVGLEKLAKACYGKAEALEKQYAKFSRKSGVPFYRERTEIMQGEDIYKRTARGKKDIARINAYQIPASP